jgi:hypothetical protein
MVHLDESMPQTGPAPAEQDYIAETAFAGCQGASGQHTVEVVAIAEVDAGVDSEVGVEAGVEVEAGAEVGAAAAADVAADAGAGVDAGVDAVAVREAAG